MYDFFGRRAKRILVEQGAREARRHMQVFHDFVTRNLVAATPGEVRTSLGHALAGSPAWGRFPGEEWEYPGFVKGFVGHLKLHCMSGVVLRTVSYRLSIIPHDRIPHELMYHEVCIRQGQATGLLAYDAPEAEGAKILAFRVRSGGKEFRL